MFVAILKQFVLKDLLTRYQWVGIAINCISIVLVGFTAMMIEASTQAANETAGDSGDGEALGLGGGTAIIGVVLILLGALVQSVQYVFEEKVMSADDNDPDVAPTPPLLLVRLMHHLILSSYSFFINFIAFCSRLNFAHNCFF